MIPHCWFGDRHVSACLNACVDSTVRGQAEKMGLVAEHLREQVLSDWATDSAKKTPKQAASDLQLTARVWYHLEPTVFRAPPSGVLNRRVSNNRLSILLRGLK